MHCRITHDSAFTDIFAAQLKLRFHENQEFRTLFCACDRSWQHSPHGYKRNVDHDEIRPLGQIRCLQRFGVLPNRNDPLVLPQLPRELIGVHIHRIYAASSPLQQAVRKASGR